MTPITLPGGVVHTASKANKATNWREVNLVRWTGDTARPIKGWEATGVGPFASRVRKIFKWADNDLNEYIAYLCETQLYVQIADELRDITPTGSELVINGTFAVDANWSKGTGVTISGGLAHFTNTADGAALFQAFVPVAGTRYEVTYTISGYTSGAVQSRLSGPASNGPIRTANGTYTDYLVGQAGQTLVGFVASDPAVAGENDAFTKVLLHFDGADASTALADVNIGGAAHVWTVGGNAQIDTAQSVFGGASGLFDGAGDYWTTPDAADYELPNGDWTIDGRFQVGAGLANGVQSIMFGKMDNAATITTYSYYFERGINNRITFVLGHSAGSTVSLASIALYTAAVNTGWHHYAIVRSGTTCTLYIDGVPQSSAALSVAPNNNAFALSVGRGGELVAASWNGWIDEFRISHAARWTAAFTPPTAAYRGNCVTLDIDNVSFKAQNLIGPGTGVAGFGEGLFGAGTFGTPRIGESRFNNPSPAYSLDNWGAELRAMTSPDGRLLRWSPTMLASENAVAVVGAPLNNRMFVVTPERYIILFGLGGERDKYGWCDQEDDTNWNFADPLSDAGYFNIEPKSPITAVCEGLNGVFMQSLNQSFFINYVGQPGIYVHTAVGALAVPISAEAVLETPDGIMWQGIDNFWVYNGVSIAPVQCEIVDWITDQIDIGKSQIFASALNVYTKTEAWFFFTSTASPNGLNDRLAIYNYKDRTWSMGTVGRTCGFNYPNDANPLMSDGAIIYQHESGNSYANYSGKPWLETHTVNVDEGTEFILVHKLFPEISGNPAGIRFSLARSTVRQPGKETYTPQRSIRDNGYVDIRETARDMRIRIDADFADGWELGVIGLDAVGRGKKT